MSTAFYLFLGEPVNSELTEAQDHLPQAPPAGGPACILHLGRGRLSPEQDCVPEASAEEGAPGTEGAAGQG